MKRRNVLAGLAALFTAGCSKIGDSKAFTDLVDGAEKLHRNAHRLIGGRSRASSRRCRSASTAASTSSGGTPGGGGGDIWATTSPVIR